MANEVAAKQSGSLALFGDDAKGFDNMTQDDLALPLSESWVSCHHK